MIIREEIIKSIKNLPPLCPGVLDALGVLSRSDSSAAELAEVIKRDPSLTANVLRYCNSPLLGLYQEVKSIKQAIALLGLSRMRRIILTASLEGFFPSVPKGYETRSRSLWLHSLIVALASEKIAKMWSVASHDEAYTAGLLHDIGKIVINAYLSREKQRIDDLVKEGRSFLEVEREILGADHMDIGALVIEKWELPEVYKNVVKFHHYPQNGQPSILLDIVHVADVSAILSGWTTGVDALNYPAYDSSFKKLGLGSKKLQKMISDLSEIALKLEKQLYRSIRNTRSSSKRGSNGI